MREGILIGMTESVFGSRSHLGQAQISRTWKDESSSEPGHMRLRTDKCEFFKEEAELYRGDGGAWREKDSASDSKMMRRTERL